MLHKKGLCSLEQSENKVLKHIGDNSIYDYGAALSELKEIAKAHYWPHGRMYHDGILEPIKAAFYLGVVYGKRLERERRKAAD